jgi:peptide/nickel transport system ATP-binding protein/oligopeptide transport system ATP-binding protein
VRFEVQPGETFAIVGESGCGKTTVARILVRLIEPDAGQILFEGHELLSLSGEALRAPRRQMQMIVQDPFASLNPRKRLREIVAEPLAIYEPELAPSERRAKARELLRRVGLDDSLLRRYPHEFSGGQRQRIGIARALILHPKLVVADEPVSALDVSVAAQALRLLRELQQEFRLAYIFISHSLPAVAQLASRIAIMRAGQFVESGPAERILREPRSPSTRELLAAVPDPVQPRCDIFPTGPR